MARGFFGRDLATKRRASLTKRLERASCPAMEESVTSALASFAALTSNSRGMIQPLRIRNGFVYQPAGDSPHSASDRRLPEPVDRPPATRIATSRGAALRLELTGLALFQSRPGRQDTRLNDVPVRARLSSEHGWADLIASQARRESPRGGSISELDKRQRQVQTALKNLAAAGLVELPSPRGSKTMFDGFRLANEEGRGARRRDRKSVV